MCVVQEHLSCVGLGKEALKIEGCGEEEEEVLSEPPLVSRSGSGQPGFSRRQIKSRPLPSPFFQELPQPLLTKPKPTETGLTGSGP